MINCHTHIFTIDHVPNRFAKKIVPYFGKFITIKFAIRLWLFLRPWYIWYRSFLIRNSGFKVTITILDILIGWFFKGLGVRLSDIFIGKQTQESIDKYFRLLHYAHSFPKEQPYINSWREAKASVRIERNTQLEIFKRLQNYYPEDAEHIVLTMDMEFMEAGEPLKKFNDQCCEIENIIDHQPEGEFLKPFLCIDPRRISSSETEGFRTQWDINKYLTKLSTKRSTDKNQNLYAGIKLYPALGYYPFDWRLIPIYKYAVEHNIPVLTHCTHGPVFSRKTFTEADDGLHPFSGIELKEKDWKGKHYENHTVNFSHPLNYLIITNKQYLTQYLDSVRESAQDDIAYKQNKEAYDHIFNETPDLSKLKVCLAHWGGGEEWDRFLEDHLVESVKGNPLDGIDDPNRFEKVWKGYSWFTLVRDMIKDSRYQFYTDISFTLHQEKFLNLLKVQLNDKNRPKVKERILFGTDYYVVSHKETEREFSVDVRGALGESLWEQISDVNPRKFLA